MGPNSFGRSLQFLISNSYNPTKSTRFPIKSENDQAIKNNKIITVFTKIAKNVKVLYRGV